MFHFSVTRGSSASSLCKFPLENKTETVIGFGERSIKTYLEQHCGAESRMVRNTHPRETCLRHFTWAFPKANIFVVTIFNRFHAGRSVELKSLAVAWRQLRGGSQWSVVALGLCGPALPPELIKLQRTWRFWCALVLLMSVLLHTLCWVMQTWKGMRHVHQSASLPWFNVFNSK